MCFCSKMNNTTKNQTACDVICKKSYRLQSHERDQYRVCPSKLSKRELENLYFALLENNLELKKTLHSQQDKLKVLSTKLQRMTVVQRNAAGKEKDCCNSKVIVKEQKEIIADLNKANEQMSDRICLLNMRLCSTKQFLKRSPAQAAKCPRCGVCPVSVKNSSMSAIEAKPSETSVKMTATSCQYIPIDASEVPKSTREVETETDRDENEGSEKQCSENKCRTVMDELKQKIVNLQEELSKSHGEYSKRISKLENDVSGLHQENTKVRSSRAASEHALQQREKNADDLRGKLREAEGRINDLKMQLTIEKRKVKELETALRLANSSSQVVKIMEKLNTPKPKPARAMDSSGSSSYYSVKQDSRSRAPSPDSPCICKSEQNGEETNNPKRVQVKETSEQNREQTSKQRSSLVSPTSTKLIEDATFLKSDDSGCTDLNKSSDAEESKASYMEHLNQETLKKISDLQMQLDGFQTKAAEQSAEIDKQKSSDLDSHGYGEEMQMTVITITEPNVVVEIQQLGVEMEDSKPEKDIDTSTPIKDNELVGVSSRTDPSVGTSWNDIVKDMEGTPYNMDEIGTTSRRSSFNKSSPDELKRAENSRNQIPGPIPTTYQTYKDKKKPFKNSKIPSKQKTDKEINNPVQEKGSCDEKCLKINDNPDNDASDKKTTDNQTKEDLKTMALTPTPNTYDTPIKSVVSPKVITIVDSKNAPATDVKKTNENVPPIINNSDFTAPSHSIPTKEDDPVKHVKKNITKAENENSSSEELAEVKACSSSYYFRSDTIVTPSQSADTQCSKMVSAQTDKTANEVVDQRDGAFEQCLSRATECRCPRAAQRDVPVFRTCSGTLRFHTTGASATLRQCDCAQTTENAVPAEVGKCPPKVPPATVPKPTQKPTGQVVSPSAARRDSATYTAAPRRDSATYTAAPRRDSATFTAMPGHRDSGALAALPARRDSATFTKPADECKCDRATATSSANTEHDVSSLSDLPPEKDGKSGVVFPLGSPPASPRDALSPGEEKATSTCTDTDTRTCDYGPLSDGELPTHATLIRPRKLSFGERPTYAHTVPQSSEAQMEATLNAISEELAHCRKLLAAAHDHERLSVSSSVGSTGTALGRGTAGGGGGRERVHRLHLAAAARRLPDTAAHTAIFTLHIGTLVLSDEAVLSSRDRSLILTWKFYDQAVAMTRMHAGRVVLFDFSTEYDVAFNDGFLNYMKQEEMPLTICDINKQDEPFATCSLPLRDALLNTNRRADMSLALMAGPAFRRWSGERGHGLGADPLVAGDELGVLDLWCCLRAPPRLRQAINSTIARSPVVDPFGEELSLARSSSRVDIQSVDDDQENMMSHELLMQPRTPHKAYLPKTGSDRSMMLGRQWSHDRHPSAAEASPTDARTSDPPEVSDVPRCSKNSIMTQKSFPTSPASIKSNAEMKEALERNVQTMSRVERTDDPRIPNSLQNMLNEERKLSMIAAAAAKESSKKKRLPINLNSQETEHNVENKYNNIGQFIELNKIAEQSKKTVKYTDDQIAPSFANDMPVNEESSEYNQADQSIHITVLWLALNEECEAMVNPQVHRLYVAYSFLGRRGAELETPISLPKPTHYAEKCIFNFRKTFDLSDADLPHLGHLSRCRAGRAAADPRDCIVFSVVSEPPEDPLGLSSCEDIGHAYLYLGDILAYSAGSAGYTEVVPVRAAPGTVCGVLAVRVDGLHVLRRCLTLSHSARDLPQLSM